MYDFCVEQSVRTNQYILFVVNIDNQKKNEIKNKLQERYHDAFFINKTSCNTDYIKHLPKIVKSKQIVKIIKTKKYKKPNKYNEAIKLFYNKHYMQAYLQLNELFLNNFSNLKINFYLGRSAFELKKYDDALNAYDRFLIHKPNNIRVQLELARTYYYQKDYSKAKISFLKLKKYKLPKNVKNNITKYLILIENKLQKHFVNGTFISGISYDSNINNKSNDNQFYIPKYDNNFINTTENVSSLSVQALSLITHRYQYSSNINLKNNILLYGKNVFKDKNKNVAFLSYIPSISYMHNEKTKIDYSLFIDFMRFGSNYYMNSYGINPSLTYLYKQDLIIKYSLKYQTKLNKLKSNKNKDSMYINANILFNKIYNKKLNINMSLLIENENKKSGNLTNIDYKAYGILINPNYKYNTELLINANLSYKNKKYKDMNNLYFLKQINNEYSYSIGGLYSLNKNWLYQFNFIHNIVNSNIISSSYNKNTISTNFIKTF